MSASQKPIRLPPLKILRVRNPNGKRERPCMSIMSSVLGTYCIGHDCLIKYIPTTIRAEEC